MGNALLRRIELIEAQLANAHAPVLINVWTSSLARRITNALPSTATNYRLVHLPFPSEEAEREFEESLLKDNPAEAERLNRL